MIYIFENLQKYANEYSKMYNLLPPSRKRLADLRTGIDKQICIFEYFFVKQILGFEGYPDFEYNENGKPSLASYNFSISHCNNILCVAVDSAPVGVDIQKIFEFNNNLANLICNERELKNLQASKNKDVFLTRLFVQKEATIKAVGAAIKDIKNIIDSKHFSYNFKTFKGHIICECKKLI